MTEHAARFDGSTLLAREILDHLQETDGATVSALAHLLGCRVADVQRALERLTDAGQVTFSGTYWSAA